MLKKTITYTDYNGNERTEDFYFNLSRAEVIEMEADSSLNLQEKLNTISNSGDSKEIMHKFKEIVLKAYGQKSEDGKRFMKSEEISRAFYETEAYSEIIMEFFQNPKSAEDFANGIIPKPEKNAAVTDFPAQN